LIGGRSCGERRRTIPLKAYRDALTIAERLAAAEHSNTGENGLLLAICRRRGARHGGRNEKR
jgi:hypothetical protein